MTEGNVKTTTYRIPEWARDAVLYDDFDRLCPAATIEVKEYLKTVPPKHLAYMKDEANARMEYYMPNNSIEGDVAHSCVEFIIAN